MYIFRQIRSSRYVTHRYNSEIQKAIVSKRRCYWAGKWQTGIHLAPLVPNEVETFSGSLVLDLRIWWRHVHTHSIFQTDWRINNHSGHKFSPSLTLLSFKPRSEWTPSSPSVLLNSCNIQGNLTFTFFGSEGSSDDKSWLDIPSKYCKICRFCSSILL